MAARGETAHLISRKDLVLRVRGRKPASQDMPQSPPVISPWRRARQVLVSLLSLAGLFIAFVALYLILPISTPPILNAQGRSLPGSIASIERWRLNGVDQSVILRGSNAAAPILVWIHGGPGTSETALFRHYNGTLEKHFLVVYWDQRYAGQSLDPFGPKPVHEETRDYVADLGELVERLTARFHKNKVVILAHSWGTVPGILYAERHPERVAAYVGIGQVADTLESEKHSYAFALGEARTHGDADAVTRLTALGAPPRKSQDNFTPRDLLLRYGGSFHTDMGLGTLALVTLESAESNWRDFAAIAEIGDFNARAMDDLAKAVLDERHTRFSVPIFFVSGRYDRQVDAALSYRYFERVQAPEKHFVWFKQSAHAPSFEEPDRFDAWVIQTILPLAQR
jgi:pimeloyl-ACP methyl ester carboxylesterase